MLSFCVKTHINPIFLCIKQVEGDLFFCKRNSQKQYNAPLLYIFEVPFIITLPHKAEEEDSMTEVYTPNSINPQENLYYYQQTQREITKQQFSVNKLNIALH